MSAGAIALLGPTASGKTALAMALAERWPCAIISVDSAQIYRGMDIGTAKPEASVLQRYPHALIDHVDPCDTYSVASFRRDALAAMRRALAEGRVPLLVGGTMMYFKALFYGLDELPPGDPAVRAQIAEQARRDGWAAIHQQLLACDPKAAARIAAGDAQRLQRALEVYLVSGRPLSDWQSAAGGAPQKQAEPRFAHDLPCPIVPIALGPSERSVLHQRIAQRFQQMLAAGLVDEVAALRRRGDLHEGLPSVRCVGYRQVWDYLEHNGGQVVPGDDYDEMVERGIIATRQLAKRQLTWLRSWQGLHWILTDAEGLQVVSPESVAGLSPLQAMLQYLHHSSLISV